MHDRIVPGLRRLRAVWAVPLIFTLALGVGCGDDDDGGTAPSPAPSIDGVTDTTGGDTVVGDILRITGDDLASASITIGGVDAPILEATDTELRVQVPSGVPVGTAVLRASNGSQSDTLPIDVTRYAVVVTSRGGGALDVIDTADFSVVTTVTATVNGGNWPKVVAFASNGSLALVPLGTGSFAWIDLTANPPAGVTVPVTDGQQILGIAVSPDGTRAAIADRGGDFVHSLSIDEMVPPYTAPVTVQTSTALGIRPRAPHFLDDDNLLVMLETSDALALMARAPVQFTDTTTRFDEGTANYPLQSHIAASGDLYVATFSSTGVRRYEMTGTTAAYADSIPASFAISLEMDETRERMAFAQGSTIELWDVSTSTPSQLDTFDAATTVNVLAIDPLGEWIAWSGVEANVLDIANDGTMTVRATNPFATPADQGSACFIGVQP